jgi:hypothetical protein
LKTQPDRTHTHGLGGNFCPKPNPTATLNEHISRIFTFSHSLSLLQC